MGCAHSQTNQNLFKCLNDQNLSSPLNKHQFKVVNIDDYGNKIKKGNIEITSTELIFYSKNKSTRWLLGCLRKYAYDENLFYFESGRRGVTGEGIFCFITNEAESIFKAVKIAAENYGNFDSIDIFQTTDLPNNSTNHTSIEEQKSDNNQLKDYVNGNVINEIVPNQNNQSQSNLQILNSNHIYANLNNTDNTFKQELDLIKLNKNYINCAEIKHFKNLSFKNKNNLKLDQNKLNNLESNQQEFNNNNECNYDDFNITYTTLALYDKNSISDFAAINQTFIDSNTNISTPQSPNSKQFILNDFKTKSEPNSPIESEFKTQQYSLIDFDKTKALKEVIDKK